MKVGSRWYRSRKLYLILSFVLLITIIYYSLSNEEVDMVFAKRDIDSRLQEAIKLYKGTGCKMPYMDPFDKEVMQFDVKMPEIVCPGKDWVYCHLSVCQIKEEILNEYTDIVCSYKDILYQSDKKYELGVEKKLFGNKQYILDMSDHVKVSCSGKKFSSKVPSLWKGTLSGFRKNVERITPPPNRKNTYNVLIFGFDSTSKNGFIRKMPKSYKVITQLLDATILDGYNIVGDGTPAALFPILTGKTELELPEVRKAAGSGTLDQMPFIFYKLKDDGYRTLYFEDMPWIGTFQYRFNGFEKQPADHYLRSFFLEEYKNGARWWKKENKYCVGDKPSYFFMMNNTKQFFELDGKKFAFTFVADITHDDFNKIGSADGDFSDFLQHFKNKGYLENTLLVVMGDHGPRYANVRSTMLGKLEERRPLMAIVLPDKLKREQPHLVRTLKINSEVLTTPHDIYATLLDVMEMKKYLNLYKVPGADLYRGLSLLETIPNNRSCSEAGVETHWCACLNWYDVDMSDTMYKRAANAVVKFINKLNSESKKCADRYLKSIDYVKRQKPNSRLLAFLSNKDVDGYLGKFSTNTKVTREEYTVKITIGPGTGVYEASMIYYMNEDKFVLNTQSISRTNAYGNEPSCISDTLPHLNMYCYCNE